MSFFYFEKKVLFFINLIFVTVQGKNYCQIAVPLPNLVHEFFLVYVVFQLNAVDQFKQRAKVGGLDTLQVPAGRVFCKNVIKQSDIRISTAAITAKNTKTNHTCPPPLMPQITPVAIAKKT